MSGMVEVSRQPTSPFPATINSFSTEYLFLLSPHSYKAIF